MFDHNEPAMDTLQKNGSYPKPQKNVHIAEYFYVNCENNRAEIWGIKLSNRDQDNAKSTTDYTLPELNWRIEYKLIQPFT